VEDSPVTQRKVMDALEARFPQLYGTVRDAETGRRRAMLRFFGCGRDLSNEPPDGTLPGAIARGEEPFRIVGAVAGG